MPSLALPGKIRPPVVEDSEDKNQRETRTAITQLASSIAGNLLGTRLLVGSGVYTPTAGTKSVSVWATGGGGGGGGAQGGGATTTAGAGGSSGVCFVGNITNGSILMGGAYSCGVGGAGGSTAGGIGGAGGDTLFRINGVDFVVKGGSGGAGMLAGGIVVAGISKPQSGTTTGPNYTSSWGYAEPGQLFVGSTWISGSGGCNYLGAGGVGQTGSVNAAESGNLYGGGGAGGAATTVGHVGGNGAAGGILIYEFS